MIGARGAPYGNYGDIPEIYGATREKVEEIKDRRLRGVNALLAMGSSSIAATTYDVSKIAGASDETAENIAIGTGLVTNTATSGATGRVAVSGLAAIRNKVEALKGNKIKVTGQKVDNNSVVKFKDLTVSLRSKLPSRLKNSGNFGAAIIDVPGVQPLMAASSGLQSKDINTRPHLANEGFVAQVNNPTFRSFTVNNSNGTPINRSVDTEAKLLNNIALQLGNNTNAKGTINLFTERPPCASCSINISQFTSRYPNIELNVIDSGGNQYTPKNSGK